VVLGFEARPDEASFAKPAGEPCRHLGPTGCSIYLERPLVCRRFRCAWLQEPSLPASLRPDRCGVMFAMNDSVIGPGFAAYAYELQPGAADRRAVARVIERVAAAAPVILIRADGGRELFTADPAAAARLRGAAE
jgi:Fe-S-cluster containining protein